MMGECWMDPAYRARLTGVGKRAAVGTGGDRFIPRRRRLLEAAARQGGSRMLTFGPGNPSPPLTPAVATTETTAATPRKIPPDPYKVLDAPDLRDDFYLNLVDWSGNNVVAVGLGTSVYLWSAETGQVNRLCDLTPDWATAVSWDGEGRRLAVGTNLGAAEVWDPRAAKRTAARPCRGPRTAALAWTGDRLASGSRDGAVLEGDLRGQGCRRLYGHRQEVCGLQWAPDGGALASGGNDNRLLLWAPGHRPFPLQACRGHTAAVKALAWSPHRRGLLASGGGTADRTLRFWNTLTDRPLATVDTGSQ